MGKSGVRGLKLNTALLTASGLVMRCIGMAWQVWLVGRIGAAGIGLYQLVMSVGSLAATVAISGIRFASTRLISEEAGSGRPGAIGGTVLRCGVYAAFFGLASMTVLYLLAEPLGFLWVGDARTVMSLRILALSMPAVSLGAVMSGYFTAVGRVWKSSLAALIEQLARITLIILLLRPVQPGELELSCAAVTRGGVIADYFSLALLVIMYIDDIKRQKVSPQAGKRLTPRMLGIALPLAVSAYARVSLNTAQQLLIPRGLKRSGMSADGALAGYGTVQGMVFPVVTFPSCILTALSEMLVPFITEAQMRGEREYIRRTVSSLLLKCLAFSLAVAALLFLGADVLSRAIYRTDEAARYIRLFSLIVPVMYMDTVVDGCLKGLGEMLRSMTYNVLDSALGVVLVLTLVPAQGLGGYIAAVFITELFNFALSMRRLTVAAGIRLLPERKK